MKSSMLMAVTGAVLATAGPLAQKRAIATDFVYEYVTVTVTEGDSATHFGPGKHLHPSTPVSVPAFTPPPPSPTSTPEPSSEPPAPSTQVVVADVTPASSPPAAVFITVQASAQVDTAPSKVQDPATPAATENAMASPTDYDSTALYYHNVHRFNHSVAALSISDTHTGYAKQVAANCVFAHDLSPGGGGYGQNLAIVGSSDMSSMTATTAMAQAGSMWYNEISSFATSDYGQANLVNSNFEAVGHFTQLVWKGTTQIGCHTQLCPAGTIYTSMQALFTVCNYFPAGNMGGGYGSNVLPPLGEASVNA